MTDPKKLPVIYICPIDFTVIPNRPWTRSVYSTVPTEQHTAQFEPSVPRCKTCNCFAVLTSGDQALCALSSRTQPYYVPRDGSGHCFEHPEANRVA